jgi:HPr kinase/phosphorylase
MRALIAGAERRNAAERCDILLGSVFGCFRLAPKGKVAGTMGELPESETLHASAVLVAGRGVLILGSSGAGKSALALGLIARGAALVADDRVTLTRKGSALLARAPEPLAGLIEARGLGILRLPAVPEAPLAFAVDLDRPPAARMPQAATITHLGVGLELISGRGVPNLDMLVTIYVHNGRAFPE